MKRSFETFTEIGPYEQRQLTSSKPFCHNGRLGIQKYKITIEVIDEPVEVIHGRIRELWKVKNHHHVGALRAVAKKYGIELE